MPKRLLFALLLALALPAAEVRAARAEAPACAQQLMEQPRMVGQGRMTFMLWHVYDAALYAPRGQYARGGDFALQLTYRQTIKGRDIADTSVEEMRRAGMRDEIKLAAWHTRMRDIFPDVKPGDVLTGVHLATGESVFCAQGREAGRIRDPEFGEHFFNIWLADTTRAPALRRSLLGGGA